MDIGFDALSICQVDYNSVIVAGNSRNMKIFDLRMKKLVLGPIKLTWDLIQIVNMIRFTDHQLIVSNIN